METYIDGSEVAVCLTSADTFWTAFYFIGSISVFFLLPFVILLVLYTIIAWNLMGNPGIISHHHRGQPPEQSEPSSTTQSATTPPPILYPQTSHHHHNQHHHHHHHHHRSNVLKYRKQVIFMLVAVVLSFFLCLLPFRAFTLWIILMPPESIIALGIEGYYNILYFCRIMLYLNSALNPILYNLMSSKFRDGFMRLLGCKTNRGVATKSMNGMRKGTFHTNSTNLSSSSSSMRREAVRGSSIRSRTDSVTESLSSESPIRDSKTIQITAGSGDEASTLKKRTSKRQKSFDDIEEEEIEEMEEPSVSSQSAYETSYSVRNACVAPFLLQKVITDRYSSGGHHQQ